MKYFMLYLLMTLSSISWGQQIPTKPSKGFYYCVSRPINQTDMGKNGRILYTEINEIPNDTLIVKGKSGEWYEYVQKHCRSKKGCTSDLNYYYNVGEAENSRRQILEKYKELTKSDIELVDFK